MPKKANEKHTGCSGEKGSCCRGSRRQARPEHATARLSAVPARWGSASQPKATERAQKPNAARAWGGTWLVGQGNSPAALVSPPARTRSSPEKQLMLSSASSPNRNNPSVLRYRLHRPTGVMLQPNAGKSNADQTGAEGAGD